MSIEHPNTHMKRLCISSCKDILKFSQKRGRLNDSPNLESFHVKSSGGSSKRGETKGTTNSNQEVWDGPQGHNTNFLYKIGAQKKTKIIFQLMNTSIRDCPICGYKELFNAIKLNLEKKYLTTRESYNTKVINDIIYNENTNITSVFKDFLILDDLSEFLKRFYEQHESVTRIPKVCDFYDKYSKIFPNFINLNEKKFMFKNIRRKQKMIDQRNNDLRKTNISLERNKLITNLFLEELNEHDSILGKLLKD